MAQKFNAPFGSGGKTVTKQPMAKAPMQAEPDGDEGAESPEQISAQHGPPVMVTHQHEHEMGSHHVHGVHADGFEHHSDHASAEEALQHHKKLVGGGGEEQQHNEEQESEPWGKE